MLSKSELKIPYIYSIEIFPDEWHKALWNGRYFLIEIEGGEQSHAYEDVMGIKYYDEGTEIDPVNLPSHYINHPSGVECIQIVEHMNFCLGNAIKYIWRAGLKDNMIQDLEKAVFYINREIERVKNVKS